MKKEHKLWLIGVGLLLLDLFTKLRIRAKYIPGMSVPVIQDIFHITYVQNKGAVFGSLQGFSTLFIWLTLIAIGAILYLWDDFPDSFWGRLFLSSIVAGLLGNFIDRIFLGFVTYFLDFRIWPVFNVADAIVCIGVTGLIISILFMKEGKVEKK